MKAIRLALALSATALLLASCGKETPIQVEEPKLTEKTEPIKAEEPKKPVKPPIVDKSAEVVENAYKSLNLVPLEIDKDNLNLPPTPDAKEYYVYPLDKAYDDFEERTREWGKGLGPDAMGYPGYVKSGYLIIPAYAKPNGFTLGEVTNPWEINRDRNLYSRNYGRYNYLAITFAFESSEQYAERRGLNISRPALFDSLNRVHQARVPSQRRGLQPYAPMPYDLRKLVVAYNGVDISPLFAIRYDDYREAARLGDFSKAVPAVARVSKMTMKDLDWLYGGFIRLYSLTEDYPRFTLIGIMKDGTIFKRDLSYPYQD